MGRLPSQREPGVVPVDLRTSSPEVSGAGFDPRSEASCGPVTGGSHPPPSHPPTVFHRDSLRGDRASRHNHRGGAHLLGDNPSPGLPAPRTWVDCVPSPAVASHRESAEPVCDLSALAIRDVGVSAGLFPVVCPRERTRFTPALISPRFRQSVGPLVLRGRGGIRSLNQDSVFPESHTTTAASGSVISGYQ